MSANFKALIVVVTIAAIIFRFAKPLALQFSTATDFSRRRNTWFVLTIAGFLSPNFWLFTLVAVPVLAWGARKDSNPLAFYLSLLLVVPSIPIDIPAPGINQLFPLDIYRLLSLCVLIPAARKLRRSARTAPLPRWGAADLLLLGYGVLQVAIFIPPDLPSHEILPDSPTNMLRRAFLFLIDVFVLYYVASRSCSNRRTIVEAIAAFCLTCAVLAPIALFECLKHWLLYQGFSERWGVNPMGQLFVLRGGILRAQTSAGHSLALGFLLATSFGFWLHLKSHVKSTRQGVAVTLLIWLGLLAAYSRGPWMGALTIYFASIALGPRSLPRLVKAVGLTVLIGAVIISSPLGDRVTSVLPFMGGSVDSGNILYRQRLAERSWALIREHPVLGDPLAYLKMQDLRQGQGIIDLVNTYAQIALFYGLLGLFLFAGFFLAALLQALRLVRSAMRFDPDLAALGVSLVACMVGALEMIASNSLGLGVEKMLYVLAGLATAYARVAESARQAVPTGVHSDQLPEMR